MEEQHKECSNCRYYSTEGSLGSYQMSACGYPDVDEDWRYLERWNHPCHNNADDCKMYEEK